MSNAATTYALMTRKAESEHVTAVLVGGGAAAMTNPEASQFGGGEIPTIVRTGTGTFTLTFRRTWPKGRYIGFGVVGTTAGLAARLSAFDPAAGTATLVTEVGAVATDPATTDTLTLNFKMRNSGRND
jgi:hypothetical protein